MSPDPATVLARLASIVGEGNCSSGAGQLARYAVHGRAPAAVARPASVDEIAELVRFAAAEKLALLACGGCSKLGIGAPPARYDVALDTTRLNRVAAYDPGDLTLGVEAGMGIQALLEVLREKNQWVPLLVPWFERATLGGLLAANTVSPLRYMFGGPRDLLLGMEFVTGEGVACKSGARVVKSVAGYDIHKLLLGSLGTLGVITRVNLRTFPLPRAQRCFVLSYPDLRSAWDLCRRVAQSPLKPALLEVLDPGAARIVNHGKLPAQQWCVVAAAIGHAAVVERHARDLATLARQTGAMHFEALEDADKQALLGRVREFLRIVSEENPDAAVLRTAILPVTAADTCEKLAAAAAQHGLRCSTLIRAGILAYRVLQPSQTAAAPGLAAALPALLAAARAHAPTVVEQCPPELARSADLWGPVREDFALMKRVKQVFDPHGVLSPGRFAGGL